MRAFLFSIWMFSLSGCVSAPAHFSVHSAASAEANEGARGPDGELDREAPAPTVAAPEAEATHAH